MHYLSQIVDNDRYVSEPAVATLLGIVAFLAILALVTIAVAYFVRKKTRSSSRKGPAIPPEVMKGSDDDGERKREKQK